MDEQYDIIYYITSYIPVLELHKMESTERSLLAQS